MLNIKFYNDRYRRFKNNFKDFIIDEKKFNHPIKRRNISLSILKKYSFFYSY